MNGPTNHTPADQHRTTTKRAAAHTSETASSSTEFIDNRPEVQLQQNLVNSIKQSPQNSKAIQLQMIANQYIGQEQRLSQSITNKNSGAESPIQRVVTANVPQETELKPEARALRDSEAANDLDAGSKYLSEVIFSGGLLYKKTGAINGRRARVQLVEGKVIYVFATNGQIYIRSEKHGIEARADGFTHANFLGGASVKTAGQMFVRGGQITRLDNESGHYKPHSSTLELILNKLISNNVNLNPILLVLIGAEEKVYSAAEYVRQERLADVPEIGNEVRREDEFFQSKYDENIGKDAIKFTYFHWPYGDRDDLEATILLRLLLEKLNTMPSVNLEIEGSSLPNKMFRGEPRNQAATQAKLNQIIAENNLRALGSVHTSTLSNNKILLETRVTGRDDGLLTEKDRRGHP
ncbi:MAG: hypothetical protein AB8G15_13010 [Saprospiraceae bacterium]